LSLLFLRKQEVLQIHATLIALFGGADGINDVGALDSALVAAENRGHYEQADLATCAATYAYHLTQAHAFLDGNKRIGAAAAEIFLGINGARLSATNEELARLFLGIADGRISREEVVRRFQEWVEAG
jgi:death-on-curing protein